MEHRWESIGINENQWESISKQYSNKSVKKLSICALACNACCITRPHPNGIAPKPTVPRFPHSHAPPAAPGRLNAALDDKHIAHFHSGTHRDRLLEEANAKAAATVARAVQSANRRFD